jgi:FMN phosphatase YigB (HAD superfamily)
MLKAILFDLDDTLLGNDMDTFLAHYFKLLGHYARPLLEEKAFIHYLLNATRTAIADVDPARSNQEVFWECFERLSGRPRSELEPFFGRFYEEVFPQLRSSTQQRPIAVDLVRSSMARGLAVVIATNPLFPASAIEQRLAWAGIPVTEFPYALVTSYENMHATKPQVAYYREILAALMVGNDWDNDVVPAAEAGLFTYWVCAAEAAPPDSNLVTGYGSLAVLYSLLNAGWPETQPLEAS